MWMPEVSQQLSHDIKDKKDMVSYLSFMSKQRLIQWSKSCWVFIPV